MPEPIRPILHRVVVGLIVRKRRSLICNEIDDCIDAMCDIRGQIDKAVEEGDLLGLLVEKDAMAREKSILKGLERLLDMEAGVIKENQDMEQAKERAREIVIVSLFVIPAVTVFYIIGVYLSEDREWFGAGNIAVGILTAIVLISFIVKQDLTGFKK